MVTVEWADDSVYTAVGLTRTMAPRPVHTLKELPLPQVDSGSISYYKNVVAVLEGKEELIATPQQALRVMRVIALTFESSSRMQGMSCHI
ncbi:MAG: hypothetical protein RR022_06590 [Angelakisella sp.]